jgi:acyl-CoA dehydrogenase
MDFRLSERQLLVRRLVAELCQRFPDEYWREHDRRRLYPEEFVRALTSSGWLSILIPEEYGGGGMGIAEASIVVEEINRSGGNAAACHAQMYIMNIILKHGTEEQRRRFLPPIARGELRLQAFAVTEPDAGSDTSKIRTKAVYRNGRYYITGQKVFISRALHSDLMLVLARTTPYEEVQRKTDGMSIFIVDLRDPRGRLIIEPIDVMLNHQTTAVYFDELEVPAENLIGEEGQGFRYLLDGLNAERILIAAECIGDGRWFVERAVRYSNQRVVFDRPIGQNQGVQFPIARAHAMVEAADLMRWKAAWLYDQGQRCGAEANMAKLLASEASWYAANVCLDVHGGMGFAVDMDVERKFRETRLYQVAPVSNNLLLAYIGQHVLGLPRSY